MLKNYEAANLIPLLEIIRKPGRYAGLNGVNVLTNAASGGVYDKAEVVRELRRAVDAGEKKDHTFAPVFSHPKQGLAYGLNPYESPRILRRLQPLRRWSHEQVEHVFT